MNEYALQSNNENLTERTAININDYNKVYSFLLTPSFGKSGFSWNVEYVNFTSILGTRLIALSKFLFPIKHQGQIVSEITSIFIIIFSKFYR